jgi:hypothetical protein
MSRARLGKHPGSSPRFRLILGEAATPAIAGLLRSTLCQTQRDKHNRAVKAYGLQTMGHGPWITGFRPRVDGPKL